MPIHEVMKRQDKARSGLALGGLGAGWVELRKDGQFYNWNLFNNEPYGTEVPPDYANDSMLFFLVRFQEEGKNPKIKLLQVDQGYEVATIPSHYYTFPWLTGVDEIDCESSFPFTRMTFRDEDMPFDVHLEAYSPFIPHDVKNSSLPAAVFRFSVTSRTSKNVDVMLLGTLRNAVAYDQPDRHYVTEILSGRGLKMFQLTAGDVEPSVGTMGTQVLASLSGDSTYYTGWEHRHPYYEYVIRHDKLRNFDDTEARNKVDEKTGKKTAANQHFNSIAVSRKLTGRGKSFDHDFVMTWHFPNLYAGQVAKAKRQGKPMSRRFEGHYYDNFFDSAADVARYVAKNLDDLTDRTRAFHADFYDSTAPLFVLDQVNSHLNTFFTSSWLTKAGDFGIQEGITPEQNWGPLATIDVGMYGTVATAALFPELDQAMIFAHRRLQGEKTGDIAHGVGRDFSDRDKHESVGGRLDLPSQYVIMALRAYFWTGDKGYLREIWPSVLRAMNYVLEYRDANGDLLPDMEGAMCTYDNFPMYGAASYVASQWLAALAYAAEAARALGDKEQEQRFEEIREKATPVFEDKLWNGSYYILYNDAGGKRGDKDEGCLTDQIIGQWAMHFIGLGDLLDRKRVHKALRTILKTCYQPEYGLLNCRWPDDEFLHPVPETCWSDQANTCWTGVELAFASFLIYEGMVSKGLEIIRNVDDRYRKFGMYYDHQEWGGHYFRPMSSWAILMAMLGLAKDGTAYQFCPPGDEDELKMIFNHGAGWAHYERKIAGAKQTVRLDNRMGTMKVKSLTLGLAGGEASRFSVRAEGKAVAGKDYEASVEQGRVKLTFRRTLSIKAGKELSVSLS